MKHAAIYSAGAMAGRIVSFIMLPFYAHILGDHGYAVLGMLDVGLGFLLALIVWGVQNSLIRLYHDEKDSARKTVVVSTGIILIGAVAAALTVPMIIFARPISVLLINNADLSHLTIMALLGFNLDMMGQAASSWLLIQSRSTLIAALSLVRLFMGLSLNIYLMLIKGMGIDGLFISALIVNLASCLIFVGIAFRNCGWEFDRRIARAIASYLAPQIPGSLASWCGLQAERMLAKTMISLESVGILEMGYKFPMLISIMIIQPFFRSWETRRFEIADQPDAPQIISRMFTHFVFLVTWAGLVLAVLIKPLLEILTPPEFHPAYRIARLDILTIIFQGAFYYLDFGLLYAKDTPVISKIRIFISVIKVSLSWFFIANWGLYGAAFSAAISSLLSAVLVFYFSQKRYPLRLEWRTLIILITVAGGMFVWLTNWNWASTGAYEFLNSQFLPWIRNGLDNTFLGGFKEGKLIVALDERSGSVSEVILMGTWAMSFAILLPLIHKATRQRFIAKVRDKLG